jgi:uncharacterized protein (DUF2147 family)
MKMFRNLTLLFMLSISILANAQSKTTDNFIGKWITEDKALTIEMYKENNLYYGKVIKAMKAKTKKGDMSVGQLIVNEMKLKKNNLEDGTVKDIDTGKDYNANFSIIDNNNIKLKVRVMPLLNFNEIWTRVN